MKIKELIKKLAAEDQDRYVVLRDPHSRLVHTLESLLEETVALHDHKDFRCGPHKLEHRDPKKNGRILHIGQQSWEGSYPPTPDVQTVGKLLAELRNRDPELTAVITHHFDELCDADVIKSLDNMGSPMLRGNPGSYTETWPKDCRKAPPDQVLLISNQENEAYSNLVRARNRELDTMVHEMESRPPTSVETTSKICRSATFQEA